MYANIYAAIYSDKKINTPVSDILICLLALFILCMSHMKYISFQNLNLFYAKSIARFS